MKHSFLKKWGTFIAACVLYVGVCIFLYMIPVQDLRRCAPYPFYLCAGSSRVLLAAWLIQGGYPKKEGQEEEELLKESGIYVEEEQKQKKHWHRPFKGFSRQWQKDMTTGQKINLFFVF